MLCQAIINQRQGQPEYGRMAGRFKSAGVPQMTEQLYIYRCGNSKDAVGRFRLQFKGRKCRLLARGTMNNRLVEFIDTGEHLNCSGNALKKVTDERIKQ